jgi:hypothetical protein
LTLLLVTGLLVIFDPLFNNIGNGFDGRFAAILAHAIAGWYVKLHRLGDRIAGMAKLPRNFTLAHTVSNLLSYQIVMIHLQHPSWPPVT